MHPSDYSQAFDLDVRESLQIKEQNKDKILPAWHPAAQKVRKIGLQVVKSALEGRGGGFQDHMRVSKSLLVFALLSSLNLLVVRADAICHPLWFLKSNLKRWGTSCNQVAEASALLPIVLT